MQDPFWRLIFAGCGIALCFAAAHWFGWIGFGVAIVAISGTNLLIARRLANLADRARFAAILDREKADKQDLAL